MIQWKKDNLPTLAEKLAEAKKQAEKDGLPDRVAEVEDAMCEQDAANEKRFVGIQTVPGLVDQPLHCHVPGIHRVISKDLVAVPELITRVVDVHLITLHNFHVLHLFRFPFRCLCLTT